MARFFKKREENKGLAPGELVFIGDQKAENPQVRIIDYTNETLRDEVLSDIKESINFIHTDTVTWINIDGLHDTELIRTVGSLFKLHPLLLEDLMNTGQRPKTEEFDNCLFVTFKMIKFDTEKNLFISDQLSMIIGETYLLTFQEKPGQWFDPVRDRIKKKKGRIRVSGIDYLAYAIFDTIVDSYIYNIERMGEKIEDLDDEIGVDVDWAVLDKINTHKKEMNYLRKQIRPAREAIIKLAKTENYLIHENTRPFLKDLQDLITQATEAIDTYREMLSDQLNMYNSSVSNKMNEIMKVLTVFAAIFIPLTFIAGVYGTNFKFLPELEFRYSYYVFWFVLIVVALIMLYSFKRKKWL